MYQLTIGGENEEKGLTPRQKILLENFKLLVEFIIADGKLFWDRFNLFTVLNSALFGGSFVEQVAKENFAVFLLSLVGLGSSCVWLITTGRGRACYQHWIKLARRIEEGELKDLTFFKEEKTLEESSKWFGKVSATHYALYVPLLFMISWFIRGIPAAHALLARLSGC
jgi:hypothetical protein